jgi:putative phosphonate catabolism associated alcohol dehydrogenase
MPETIQGAVFTKVGQPLTLEQFERPTLTSGQVLCKVRMSTICGSDLHTIMGRRTEPVPLILGHEIVGQIVELGPDAPTDYHGHTLSAGQVVTWSIMANCGECYYCTHDLPQKCVALFKYGHARVTDEPGLSGGFAEYVVLRKGTTILPVPEGLTDSMVTPTNCTLATAMYGMRRIELAAGESVLIQGAGLLGLYQTVLAKEAGASKVIVVDVSPKRLEWAKRFGADMTLTLDDDPLAAILAATDGHGVDVAFEVCGATEALRFGIDAFRLGGRYLLAGLVTPAPFDADVNLILRKCLTIRGIHNYRPEDLAGAVAFLKSHARDYPFADLIAHVFPLSEINDAIALAEQGDDIRVAICP